VTKNKRVAKAKYLLFINQLILWNEEEKTIDGINISLEFS